jgi:hypothetical protein
MTLRRETDRSLLRHRLQTKGLSAEGVSQAMDGDVVGSAGDRLRFQNLARRERRVYKDPQQPGYNNGKPVVDHIKARALGGHATDSGNLRVIPNEMNSRKGGYEGKLKKDRAEYIRLGLSKAQVDLVLADELRGLGRDAIPRPMDPKVLDRLEA